MKTFYATFESEYGMEFAEIKAKNLREATKILKERFPEDHGADGFWDDEDGNEIAINWEFKGAIKLRGLTKKGQQ